MTQQMHALEEAVRNLLKPIEGTFAYEDMVKNHLNTEKYRPWVEVIDTFKPVQNSVVLSSGCGSANDLVAFLDKGARRVCGVEVDSELVRIARLRFADDKRRDKVEITLYNGRTLPYENQQFDIIFSVHVIEHVTEVEMYLSELFRVLRPEGVLFIDFPNRFFRYEQHTGLPFVHLFPHRLREAMLAGALLPMLRRRWNRHTAQKLNALRGMRPPYPWQVMRGCQKSGRAHGMVVEEAIFHDYGMRKIPFDKALVNLIEIFRNTNTCRFILHKTADGYTQRSHS